MSRVLPLIPALRLVPKQRIIFKLGQRRPQNRTDRPPGLLGLKWGVFAVTGPREQGVAQNALHGAQQRLSLEQPRSSFSRLAHSYYKYYGFPVDDWDRYPQEVAEVAPAEVQEIANKYIDLDHLQIVGVR